MRAVYLPPISNGRVAVLNRPGSVYLKHSKNDICRRIHVGDEIVVRRVGVCRAGRCSRNATAWNRHSANDAAIYKVRDRKQRLGRAKLNDAGPISDDEVAAFKAQRHKPPTANAAANDESPT